MCGICGVVQLGGEPREPISRERLDAMTDIIAHRGPDDRGVHLAPGVALGARRLSIVDVGGGHQPMFNEDQTVVAVQNGELYNHDALRAELTREGHVFQTRCDTEVLPHLYEREREAFPEQLRGKFAIAIWDEAERRAVLARDRMGVKPLYWAQAGDLIVFASELKSVLASGLIRPRIDLEAIDLYFALGFIPGPRTPVVGVQKLDPGSALVIEDGSVRSRTYWRYPEPAPSPERRGLAQCADELLDLLREAVRDRLMSDVSLGAMLSGGLDSSLIVALMAEMSATPVQTFSVGFREDAKSELPDARRIADLFGCEHHELELSVTDVAIGLDELAWHLDEPLADLSTLGFDVLARTAAEHVTVALSGQGADELFGGYTKHRAAAAIAALEFVPNYGRKTLAGAPWPSGRARRALNAFAAPDATSRFLAMSGRLDDELRSGLYRGELAAVPQGNAFATVERFRAGLTGDPLSVMLYIDAKLGLVDHMLLYFDRASMAHSLEVRVPFLDHRLVEWAATLPPSMRVRHGVAKRVLREAARRVLPPESLRKKKVGFFRFALQPWLDAQLDSGAESGLRAPCAAFREIISPDAVETLVRNYIERPREDEARIIFALLMLEAWLKTYVTEDRVLLRSVA
jgi:asparagine synthase (glutamine-hydrolysing)